MKKIALTIVKIAIVMSTFAQIDMYEPEVVMETKKTWQDEKNEILQILKNNTIYPIAELNHEENGTWRFVYEEKIKLIKKNYKNLYLIGDTLFSSNNFNEPILALSCISNDTITVCQLPNGRYYHVEDIILTQQEKDLLFNNFTKSKFQEQKLKVVDNNYYKLKRKMDGEFIWNLLYKDSDIIYVLKNNNKIYYIRAGKKESNFYPNFLTFYGTPIKFEVANISNFISLKSYNMLKDMYVNKELTTFYEYFNYYSWKGFDYLVEPKKTWNVQKISVKENKFVLELASKEGKTSKIITYRERDLCHEFVKAMMRSIEKFKKEENNFEGYIGDYDSFCNGVKVNILNSDEYRNGTTYVTAFVHKSYADSIIKEWETVVQNKIIKLKRENEEYRENIIKKYGATYGNLILDNKISIGMTQEMCIEAYGTPYKKNKTTSSLGTVDVWTYKRYDWSNDTRYIYVTFVNDKITEIYE